MPFISVRPVVDLTLRYLWGIRYLTHAAGWGGVNFYEEAAKRQVTG